MVRIAWLSRHEPLPVQIDTLRAIFGDIEITQDARTWGDASAIVERVKGFDEVVIVAPLSLIAELLRRGLRPIRADMQLMPPGTEFDPYRDVAEKDRHYRFMKFSRIVRLELVTEDLVPQS